MLISTLKLKIAVQGHMLFLISNNCKSNYMKAMIVTCMSLRVLGAPEKNAFLFFKRFNILPSSVAAVDFREIAGDCTHVLLKADLMQAKNTGGCRIL